MLLLHTLLSLAAASSAVASPLIGRAPALVQPSLDSFYAAPQNLARYQPGDIIRQRTVQTSIGNTRSQYQLLYRTVDALGRLDSTVATVLAPAKPAPGPPKIFSLQQPQDSAAFDCVPSFTLLKDTTTNATDVGSLFVLAQANAATYKGYYVVIADFQGSRNAFSVGLTEGRQVLDGIRALLKHVPTLPDSRESAIVLSGYSGGAHAASWAAQISASYAPELNIVGLAAGGTPIRPKALLEFLNRGIFAGLAGAALASFIATYDDLNDYLRSILTPEGETAMQFLQGYACASNALQKFAFKDMFKFFTKSPEEIFASPIVSRRMNENILGAPGAPVPSFPQYIYSGVLDQVIEHKGIAAYVDEQCRRGARINFNADLLAEHLSEQFQQFMPQFQWSIDALEGKTASVRGCERHDNVVSLLPRLFTSYGKELVGPAAIESVRQAQAFV